MSDQDALFGEKIVNLQSLMKHFMRILLIVTAMTLSAIAGSAAAPTLWEAAGSVTVRDTERLDDSGMEITVRDGVVTLILTRPAQVRVLTILGQPLSQENLPAGIHRLRLTAKGIYIVRVGQTTRRVTI